MNIVLLSGGSGKRLWPLSNDIRSKQFIKIFKKGRMAPMNQWYNVYTARYERPIKMQTLQLLHRKLRSQLFVTS